jgi:uncharacterized OB-fold protein
MGSLINCRTCGSRVAASAKMCPNCGEHSPEPYREKFKYGLLGFIVVLFVLLVIIAASTLIFRLNS